MPTDPSDIWARCLLAVEKRITSQSFHTWFRPTGCSYFDADTIRIEVPTSFFADWLEENYATLIQSIIEDETAASPEIEFSVRSGDTLEPPPFTEPTPPSSPPTPYSTDTHPNLISRYTFDNFVVGSCNQFTHSASLAVADAPGMTAFNPLVVFGGVGLGKTHILQATGNHCLAHNTARNIVYVSSEEFVRHFIQSMLNERKDEFVHRYRSADLLMVDDIQFFLRKEGTQIEFFHTFNALYQKGKQIILSSDRPPSDLTGLHERLISRFQSGLTTAIDPPDVETRIAILKKKAGTAGIELTENVAAHIAARVSSNIRELEGCLTRLIAHSSFTHQPLSEELAEELLDRTQPAIEATSQPTIDLIQRVVANHFQIAPDLLIAKTRRQEIAIPRHIAMFLAKTLVPNTSHKTIGLHFGGRDHSTVVHAYKTISKRTGTDADFAGLLRQLSTSIRSQCSS